MDWKILFSIMVLSLIIFAGIAQAVTNITDDEILVDKVNLTLGNVTAGVNQGLFWDSSTFVIMNESGMIIIKGTVFIDALKLATALADGSISDAITIAGGAINLGTNTMTGTLGGGNITDDSITETQINEPSAWGRGNDSGEVQEMVNTSTVWVDYANRSGIADSATISRGNTSAEMITATGSQNTTGWSNYANASGTADLWDALDTPLASWTQTNTSSEIWAVVDNGTFVPYTEATKNVDLGAYNLTTTGMGQFQWVDKLENLTQIGTPPADTLRLYVEDIHGFSFYKFIDSTGMKRALVRDNVILVKNVRGTTIAANRIVYATGSEDNVPTVNLAKADNLSTMPAIGVTIESIANGSFGRVMQVGLLENINTDSLTEGDILYVSDETAGVPKTTQPLTPNLTQEIGTVLVKSATVGAIQIVARGPKGNEFGTIQNTFQIGNGSDTNVTLTFNGGDTLMWNNDTQRFEFGNSLSLGAFNLTIDTNVLFVDEDTNRVGIGQITGFDPRAGLSVTGDIDLTHTATESDDHAMEITVDAAGFGDVKGVVVDYITGTISAGEAEEAILINIDESSATGGNIIGLEILSTEGSAKIYGIKAGALVNPIVQLSGVFSNMDSALVKGIDNLANFTSTTLNATMFVADDDNVTIGDAAKFEEIEFLLETVASNPGIKPTFEYSNGTGVWVEFSPTDGTGGMRNTGVIAWDDSDIPDWSAGAGSEYLIRINRTQNALSTVPVENKVQIASTTKYEWDENGNLVINGIMASGNITPDTNNTGSVGNATDYFGEGFFNVLYAITGYFGSLYGGIIYEAGTSLTLKYLELTDSFGGNVSGTYDDLTVVDTAGLSYTNITDPPSVWGRGNTTPEIMSPVLTAGYWNDTVAHKIAYTNLTICGSGQILKESGGAWTCQGDDTGGNTSAEIWAIVDNGTINQTITMVLDNGTINLTIAMIVDNGTFTPYGLYLARGNKTGNTTVEIRDATHGYYLAIGNESYGQGVFLAIGNKTGNTSIEIWNVANNGTFYNLEDGMSYKNISDVPSSWGRGNSTTEVQTMMNSSNFATDNNLSADYFIGNLSCTNIIGGSDTDFCADATGAGGAGVNMWVDNGTYLTPNVTYANSINLTEVGAFIDALTFYIAGVNLLSIIDNGTFTPYGLYLALGNKTGNTTDEIMAPVLTAGYWNDTIAHKIAWENLTGLPSYITGNTSLQIWGVIDNETFYKLEDGMSYTNITDPPSVWGRGNTSIEIWVVVNNGTFYNLEDGMSYTNITDASSLWGRGNTSIEIWVVANNGTFYNLEDGMSYTNISDVPSSWGRGNTTTEIMAPVLTAVYWNDSLAHRIGWGNLTNLPTYITGNTSLQIWGVVDNDTFCELDTGMSYTNITDEPWIEASEVYNGSLLDSESGFSYTNISDPPTAWTGNSSIEIWTVVDNETFCELDTGMSYTNITDPPSTWGRGNTSIEIWTVVDNETFYELDTGMSYTNITDAPTGWTGNDTETIQDASGALAGNHLVYTDAADEINVTVASDDLFCFDLVTCNYYCLHNSTSGCLECHNKVTGTTDALC